MRIVCISDTHLLHSPKYVLGEKHILRASDIPDGDVLIHAGDLTFNGTFLQIKEAGEWLASLPHRQKVVIAGNHDFLFEKDYNQARIALGDQMNGIIYLQDSWVEIGGLLFWGSPWTPRFYDWAFQIDRVRPESERPFLLTARDRLDSYDRPFRGSTQGKPADEHWAKIPDDVDILITHGPPYGTLDKTYRGEKVGCEALAARIGNLPKLRLHVFGHIHPGYGQTHDSQTTFVNASIADETYSAVHQPIVIDL